MVIAAQADYNTPSPTTNQDVELLKAMLKYLAVANKKNAEKWIYAVQGLQKSAKEKVRKAIEVASIIGSPRSNVLLQLYEMGTVIPDTEEEDFGETFRHMGEDEREGLMRLIHSIANQAKVWEIYRTGFDRESVTGPGASPALARQMVFDSPAKERKDRVWNRQLQGMIESWQRLLNEEIAEDEKRDDTQEGGLASTGQVARLDGERHSSHTTERPTEQVHTDRNTIYKRVERQVSEIPELQRDSNVGSLLRWLLDWIDEKVGIGEDEEIGGHEAIVKVIMARFFNEEKVLKQRWKQVRPKLEAMTTPKHWLAKVFENHNHLLTGEREKRRSGEIRVADRSKLSDVAEKLAQYKVALQDCAIVCELHGMTQELRGIPAEDHGRELLRMGTAHANQTIRPPYLVVSDGKEVVETTIDEWLTEKLSEVEQLAAASEDQVQKTTTTKRKRASDEQSEGGGPKGVRLMSRRPCEYYRSRRGCLKGDDCDYRHDEEEGERRGRRGPSEGARRGRSNKCRSWEAQGSCSYGNRCRFEHDDRDRGFDRGRDRFESHSRPAEEPEQRRQGGQGSQENRSVHPGAPPQRGQGANPTNAAGQAIGIHPDRASQVQQRAGQGINGADRS